MNIKRLQRIKRLIDAEYDRNDDLCAINSWGIHVNPEGMTKIASLDQWELNMPRGGKYPFEHRIFIDGDLFYSITKERVTL